MIFGFIFTILKMSKTSLNGTSLHPSIEVNVLRKFHAVLASLLAIFFLVSCAGDDDIVEEPSPVTKLISTTPPSGSTIAANASIIITFGNIPAELKVSAGLVAASGKIVTVSGPFTPGPLSLVVNWVDGSTTLAYTVATSLEVSQDIPELVPPARVPIDDSVVTANTRFGFNLFNEIRKTKWDQNLFISPLSVSISLAMTLNGAMGETEQAMTKVLQLQGLDAESINTDYRELLDDLQAPNPGRTLTIVNSLWARQDVLLKKDFLQRNTQSFSAEISTLDFNDPIALHTINQWVNDNTNGKIPQILQRIDPNDVMLLINTIYFKAEWQDKFDLGMTQDINFRLITDDKKRVPMMVTRGWNSPYPYYRGDTFQAVSLPYSDGQISMYIFLPDPEIQLETFLESLNVENWETWMSQFQTQHVLLAIPKFRLEYKAELSNVLKALGMGIAFTDEADFSRMALPFPGPLSIDEVIHHTVIDVNEEGTEAAAAVVIGEIVGAPFVEIVEFIANRPFFFAIRDNETKTVLFMGVVMEP